MPLSSITMVSLSVTAVTVIFTVPCSVNLHALARRLETM